MLLFVVIYWIQISLGDISELFSVSIEDDFNQPPLSTMISDTARSLATNGYFKINNFVNAAGLLRLQHIMLTDMKPKMIDRNVWKSIFGDQGDFVNFPNSTNNEIHPRNVLGNLKVSSVAHSDLSQIFDAIYRNDRFLEFIKTIVTKTNLYSDNWSVYQNLYRSNDPDGANYVFLYRNNEGGEWHVDHAPFSCVLMIFKPEFGGKLYHFPTRPKKIIEENRIWHEWNWDVIKRVFQNDTDTIKEYAVEIDINEGDLYCFKGNETIHATQYSYGRNIHFEEEDVIRAIYVMTYADYDGFVHYAHVSELNAWNKHKTNEKHCQNNKECVSTTFDTKNEL
eukprot:291691_1